MKKEIEIKADIEFLIDQFYSKLIQDQEIGHFFNGLNLVDHLPRIVHFWSFVLLDETGYHTNVTEKHAHMKLKSEHFDRWVSIFHETVDSYFEGEKAKMAKERATLVAWTMNSKFNPNASN